MIKKRFVAEDSVVKIFKAMRNFLISFTLMSLSHAQDVKPLKRIEVDEANYFLKNFERYVNGLGGKEGFFDKDAKRALAKVAELNKNYPDEPRVIELYKRAQAAARKLKGDRIEVTEQMLAFRDIESKKLKLLTKLNVDSWLEYQDKLLSEEENLIVKPFPFSNPESVSFSEMKGVSIILPGLRYPENVFLHYGQQYVAIGSAAKGYYYINTSSQSFIGAYEAVRRYQREVTDQIPADWTVVGKIVAAQVMVPGGGDAQQEQAHPGWLVEVDTIYVSEHVFAKADPKHEAGGSFSGEDKLSSAIGGLFTVQEIPAECKPDELIGIFVIAIKEKNFELYKKCIHPEEQRTAVQREWIQRKWDIFQHKFFRDKIVAVHVGKTDEIRVLQGGVGTEEKELLAEFLDESEVKEIADDGLPRSEVVTLWLKLYDETGRIREYQKPLTLKRDEKVGDFRWFVKSGFPF